MFGKKKGAPVGNKNAQGKHYNRTGLTDGRVLGTAVGALGGPVFSGVHGVVRGARGAKSRAGSAFLGGAAAGAAGGALAGAVLGLGGSGSVVPLSVLGAAAAGTLNGGVHKIGHALGRSHYENAIDTGKRKRGLK